MRQFDKHCIRAFRKKTDARRAVPTHIDSADPFRFLLGTECSPFFPYRRICTGVRTIRTRRAYCGPENRQSDRKNLNFVDGHVWERCCVKWGKGFQTVYLLGRPQHARIEILEATACINSEDCGPGCRAQNISLTHRKRGKSAFI
jgi:hypothetical protein